MNVYRNLWWIKISNVKDIEFLNVRMKRKKANKRKSDDVLRSSRKYKIDNLTNPGI
jgi:hypothetical protein